MESASIILSSTSVSKLYVDNSVNALRTRFDNSMNSVYTIAQTDSSINTLKSFINANYALKSEVASGVSSASADASINDLRTDLATNYYTKSTVDTSINNVKTALNSSIATLNTSVTAERTYVDSSLNANYYTRSTVDTSINNVKTALNSSIATLNTSITAERTYVDSSLNANYYTRSTVDTSINNVKTALDSSINTLNNSTSSRLNILDASMSLTATKTYVDNTFALKSDLSSISNASTDASINNIRTDLATNYYTKTAVDSSINSLVNAVTSAQQAYTDSKVSALIDSAPETLNTLKELSQAINGDASFNVTVFNKIASSDASINTVRSSVDTINSSLSANYYTKSVIDASLTGIVSANGNVSITPATAFNVVAPVSNINNRLIVGGDVSLNSKLAVRGDISLNGKINYNGIAGIISNSDNSQTMTFASGTTLGTINVGSDQTSGILNIGTGASRTGAINIGSNSSSNVGINIGSSTSTVGIKGTTYIGGNDATPVNTYISSGPSNSATYINNNASNNGSVFIANGGGVNTIKIGSSASTLEIRGTTRFYNNTDISGTVSISTATANTNNVNVLTGTSNVGKLVVGGDVSFNRRLVVNGDVSMNGNVTISGTNILSSIASIDTTNNNQDASINSIITNLSTNYYTKTQSDLSVNTLIANYYTKSAIDASINTNYYNKTAVDTSINNVYSRINTLIGGASTAFDTLLELQNALGSDASFSNTVLSRLNTSDSSINSINSNLSNYYTKTQSDATIAIRDASINSALTSIASINTTNSNQDTSINSITSNLSTNYYTKSQSDATIAIRDASINSAITTNTLIDTSINSIATNLSANYYTRSVIDASLTGIVSANGNVNISPVTAFNITAPMSYVNGNLDIGTGSNLVAINKDVSAGFHMDISGNLRVSNASTFQNKVTIGMPSAANIYELDLSGQMRIYEPVGTAASVTNGSLTFEHGDASGTSSIVFKSKNSVNDYAYIQYQENVGGASEKGIFTIGIENDPTSATVLDRISLYSAGGSGYVGVNTKDPLYHFDVSGSTRLGNNDSNNFIGGNVNFSVPVDAIRSEFSSQVISDTVTVTAPSNIPSFYNGTYVFTASSYNTTYNPYKAFNRGVSTAWRSSINGDTGPNGAYNQNPYSTVSPYSYQGGTSGSTVSNFFTTVVDSQTICGEWLQIKLPFSFGLKSYNIIVDTSTLSGASSRVPGEFYMAGSNDGTTWSLVDYNASSDGALQYGVTYTLTTQASNYTYYRLITTKLAGNTGVLRIGELYLFGYPASYTVGKTTIGNDLQLYGKLISTTTEVQGNFVYKNRPSQNYQDISFTSFTGYYALDHKKSPVVNYEVAKKAISSWTTRFNPNTSIVSVKWCSKLLSFYAVGGSYAYLSSDGVTWTSALIQSGVTYNDIVWSNELNIFCAVGQSNVKYSTNLISTSPDAVTWTTQTHPLVGSSSGLKSIDWSPELNIFNAVGYYDASGGGYQASYDGVNWVSNGSGGNNNITVWANALKVFIMTDTNGIIGYGNANGTNYSILYNNSLGIREIVWSEQLGILIGYSGTNVYYSYDGKTWTVVNNLTTTFPCACTWAAELGMFCLIDGAKNCYTSQNGVDWVFVRTMTEITGTFTFGKTLCWSPELSMFCLAPVTSGQPFLLSTLKYRIPTIYNTFNSSYNAIDESGNWTLSGYYTNTVVDTSINNAITTVYSYVDTSLNTNYYNKTAVDTSINNVYSRINTLIGGASTAFDTLLELQNALGSDASFSNTVLTRLNTSDSSINSVNTNLSANYYTKTQSDATIAIRDASINSALTSIASINTTNSNQDTSINSISTNLSTNYYTKTQSDLSVNTLIANYYTKTQSDLSVNTLISNYYTKSAIDASINSNYYNKTAVDTSINNVYTRINTLIGGASSAFDTLLELQNALGSDASFSTTVLNRISTSDTSVNSVTNNLATNYYTKTQSDLSINTLIANYYTKTQSDATIAIRDSSINSAITRNGIQDTSINSALSSISSINSTNTLRDTSINSITTNLSSNYYTRSVIDASLTGIVSANGNVNISPVTAFNITAPMSYVNGNLDIGTGSNLVAINKVVAAGFHMDVSGNLRVSNASTFQNKVTIGMPGAANNYELDLSGQMRIFEPVGTVASTGNGSLTFEHGDASGTSSIVFKSKNNSANDYAYIQYQENVGGASEKGLFTIGIENDPTSATVLDRISLYSAGGSGYVGVNTKDPLYNFDVSGTAYISGNLIVAGDVSINNYISAYGFNTSNRQPPSALTSNVTNIIGHGQYTAYTSSAPSGGSAYLAFDYSTITGLSTPYGYNSIIGDPSINVWNYSDSIIVNGVAFPGYRVHIDLPYETNVTSFRVVVSQSFRSPVQASLIGSNDGLSWYEIYSYDLSATINNRTPSTAGTFVFNFANTAYYSKYAYIVKSITGATRFSLLEIYLFGNATFSAQTVGAVSISTSNSMSVGTNANISGKLVVGGDVSINSGIVVNGAAVFNNNVSIPNYYSKSDIDTSINNVYTRINTLIGGASTAFDTLLELQNALGSDANFSTTVLNRISTSDTSVNSVTNNLATNYYTKTQSDATIAIRDTSINSLTTSMTTITTTNGIQDASINSITTNLATNYYTKTQSDTSLNNALTAIKTTFNTDNIVSTAAGGLNINKDGITDVNILTGTTSNKLVVGSDASFNKKLIVGGDVSLNGKLSFNGVAGSISNSDNSQTMSFASGTTLGTINIGTDQTSGTLNIGTGASRTGAINILTGASATGKLVVGGDVSFNGNLVVARDAQAQTFTATSDYRLKRNVIALDDTYTVDVLRPVEYEFISTNKKHVGFIAHEVQEHYPFLVKGEKDGPTPQSVDYNGFIGILTKEIKELKAKLLEQSSKLLEQEMRIQALESKP